MALGSQCKMFRNCCACVFQGLGVAEAVTKIQYRQETFRTGRVTELRAVFLSLSVCGGRLYFHRQIHFFLLVFLARQV